MKASYIASSLFLASLISVGSAAYAAPTPAQDVNPNAHPNLAAAQATVRRAYDQISVAQQANNSLLGGHAENAKRLLDQASEELKAAALTANAR